MAKGKKYGGRKKGTPNKATLAAEIIANKFDTDPFEILMQVACGDWKGLGFDAPAKISYSPQGIEFEEPHIKLSDRVSAAKEANKFLRSAKPLQVETPPDGEGFIVKVLDYTSKKAK